MGRGERFAPWAQREEASRGRRHHETEHVYRSRYARDRDRIIHCRAFRRLEYKTQVFVNHEGDHYRNRLTHSIEVSQIARTVARALSINEDLAESLALSHDLGHTPFGHLGEDVLDPLMRELGGFDHNRQTLRVVEVLERRYPDFPGLNLTWEVREGIVKHSGQPEVSTWPEAREYLPEAPPTLEAQLIDLVDEIAYNHHDLEDGFESGLLDREKVVDEVPIFAPLYHAAARAHPSARSWMWIKIALRRLVDRLVTDLIETTRGRLVDEGIESVEQLRERPGWIVSLSDEVAPEEKRLKTFLSDRLYKHPRIGQAKAHFASVLSELFAAYCDEPRRMPERFRARLEADGVQRVACDYIAGMTDRYALDEHERLCGGPGPASRPSATR